jgi:hypothetical protein
MTSVKQQFINLKEGKMTQAQFMRNIRISLPQYITNVSSFEDTIKILKNKAILTEADIYGIAGDPEAEAERKSAGMGIKPMQTPEEKYSVDRRIDQFELKFLKKMYSKNPTEKLKKIIDDLENRMNLGGMNEVKIQPLMIPQGNKYEGPSNQDIIPNFNVNRIHIEDESRDENWPYAEYISGEIDGYNISYYPDDDFLIIHGKKDSLRESYTTNTSGKELYSKFNEIDNLNGQEVLIGIDYEMIKNCDLTKNEAAKIVIKNLKKNPIYYTAQDMSAVENYELKYIGGKSANAEARRMQPYAADKVVDKKMGMQLVKGVEKIKASSNKAHKETNKPEGTIKMMSLVAKSSRGVKKMDATGEKMKKSSLKENQDVDLNTLNNMLNNHDWYFEMSDDERAYDAGKAMETKLQMLARKLGQEGVDAYNDVQSKIFPTKTLLTLEKTPSTFNKIKSNEPSNPKLDALRDKINKMIMKEYSTLSGGDNMVDTLGHMMDTSTNNKLFEVQLKNISIGDTFKLAGDLGKFTKNEEVEVVSVGPFGNDIKLVLSNGKDKDDFYLDKN